MREYKHAYCSGQNYSASSSVQSQPRVSIARAFVHPHYRFAHAQTPMILHFSAFISYISCNIYPCVGDDSDIENVLAESRNKMSRITSAGDLYYTGDGSGRGSSSGERDRLREYQERGRRRSSADESQTSTRSSQRGSVGGSSSGGGGRLRFSASGGSSGGPDGHHKVK